MIMGLSLLDVLIVGRRDCNIILIMLLREHPSLCVKEEMLSDVVFIVNMSAKIVYYINILILDFGGDSITV